MNSYSELFQIEGEEISALGQSIAPDEITHLVTILKKNTHNVFLTGCGTSAMAARKITHTLNVVGLAAFYLNPSDAVHGGLGQVKQNDVVIFISKGGSTKELTSFVANIEVKKAQIITITENLDSVLAQKADLAVQIKVKRELDKFNLLATTSTLAVISLFDVIAVLLMQEQHFSKNDFLLNHPAGKVGKQLAKEVKND